MPAGSDPSKVRDAARAFAVNLFAGEHDYVLALHTDAPHPHVHMAICSRGDSGQRLNPKKADLELWRQVFAQALRDRGVEAEATPRRARGVARKAERGPLRRIGDRHSRGESAMATVLRSAYREAAKAAFNDPGPKPLWEVSLVDRQARIRSIYLAQAKLLLGANDPETRALGGRVEAFVRAMPQPDSQRLALARELRAANRTMSEERNSQGPERTR